MHMRLLKFVVAEMLAETDSDEAPIGTRETRAITVRELAVLVLAMVRGN